VTWKSAASGSEGRPGATPVFDSSKIPGEIQDLLVINTENV